jgi:hypothetical protein
MNAISIGGASPLLDTIHEPSHESVSQASGGSTQEASGSVKALIIELQDLRNKEQDLRNKEADRQKMLQEQSQHSNGFFGSIANFFSGSDPGAGTVRPGLAATERSNAPWEPWKFLKVR